MTAKYHYRVTVPPGRLAHLPDAVGPDTGWLPAESLVQAYRAVTRIAHALNQCLGQGIDPGGDWHALRNHDGHREIHRYAVRPSNGQESCPVLGEIRRA